MNRTCRSTSSAPNITRRCRRSAAANARQRVSAIGRRPRVGPRPTSTSQCHTLDLKTILLVPKLRLGNAIVSEAPASNVDDGHAERHRQPGRRSAASKTKCIPKLELGNEDGSAPDTTAGWSATNRTCRSTSSAPNITRRCRRSPAANARQRVSAIGRRPRVGHRPTSTSQCHSLDLKTILLVPKLRLGNAIVSEAPASNVDDDHAERHRQPGRRSAASKTKCVPKLELGNEDGSLRFAPFSRRGALRGEVSGGTPAVASLLY